MRRQITPYQDREVKPRHATDATRLVLVLLPQVFAWRDALLRIRWTMPRLRTAAMRIECWAGCGDGVRKADATGTTGSGR